MSSTIPFEAGGYAFIPGVFQYSAGVGALPGYRIDRVRFREPVPLGEGFARIAEEIERSGRPLASFCACELRSPAPFTEAGFRAFNEGTKDCREVDFLLLRRRLAEGAAWSEELVEEVLAKAHGRMGSARMTGSAT